MPYNFLFVRSSDIAPVWHDCVRHGRDRERERSVHSASIIGCRMILFRLLTKALNYLFRLGKPSSSPQILNIFIISTIIYWVLIFAHARIDWRGSGWLNRHSAWTGSIVTCYFPLHYYRRLSMLLLLFFLYTYFIYSRCTKKKCGWQRKEINNLRQTISLFAQPLQTNINCCCAVIFIWTSIVWLTICVYSYCVCVRAQRNFPFDWYVSNCYFIVSFTKSFTIKIRLKWFNTNSRTRFNSIIVRLCIHVLHLQFAQSIAFINWAE